MRTFVAIDIPDEIRQRIADFMEALQRFAPDVRWVSPASLHITLKFIGEVAPERLPEITAALRKIKSGPFDVSFRETGFFPNARAPRVFWIGVAAGERLQRVAHDVDEALVALPALKLEREREPYHPHLTLARSGSGRPQRMRSDAPNNRFRLLAEKLPSLAAADFGTMTAREFILYESTLTPQGARYSRRESFPLG
jgi:2'-5' RNA ligase